MNNSGISSFMCNWRNLNSTIVVGNCKHIPIIGSGTTKLPKPLPPLTLKNILFASHIIKNLISIRQVTLDN